jgi:hypothetical protein
LADSIIYMFASRVFGKDSIRYGQAIDLAAPFDESSLGRARTGVREITFYYQLIARRAIRD